MSDYNFDLDMNSRNSNSVILQNIKPGSKVYEFGCAHGRMTRHLKQELFCEVIACEINEQAARSAEQFTDWIYIGRDADLNEFDRSWKKEDTDFDYLIFADVLEHLLDPVATLTTAKKLLGTEGSVWISIPNISHNSVMIDLFNDKFEYRDIGLLDRTHLKFFTEKSLEQFVSDCGLRIVTKHNLPNLVEHTEFGNSYEDVPPSFAELLKGRRNGNTYQFVWELKHG